MEIVKVNECLRSNALCPFNSIGYGCTASKTEKGFCKSKKLKAELKEVKITNEIMDVILNDSVHDAYDEYYSKIRTIIKKGMIK